MTDNAKPEHETPTANILTLGGLEFVCARRQIPDGQQ
jgi:hypothetical protein